MNWKRLIVVIIAMIVIGSANALTHIVDIDGSGQYTSIQAAVNASSPGDSVLVYPGRYFESIIISTSNLCLFSLEYLTNNPAFIDSTIIDGNANSLCLRVMENIQNIHIRGFSMTHGRGVFLYPNSISRFVNCNIFNNTSLDGAGMNVGMGSVYLSGVNIHDNYAYNMGGGMYIYGYMGTVSVTFDPVNRCSIYNNTAGAGQDIVAHSINNDLNIPLQKFTVANPSTYYAAPHRAWGNEFRLNIIAVEAHHEEINSDLYVSPDGNDNNDGLSPTSALKTIRTAVYRIAADSLNQKTVHILPGTYSRTANQQVFPIPLKSWVKVQGAGIDDTHIIGEVDPAFANTLYNPVNVFTSFYQTYASLQDLSITTSGSNNSCAIWGYREHDLHLINLRMNELSPDLYAVIHVSNAINTFWDNVTIENIVTDDHGLIACRGSMSGVVKNCIFRNGINTFNSSEVWCDPLIWIEVMGDIRFENCVFDSLTVVDDDSDIMSFGFTNRQSYHNSYSFINSLFCNLQSHSRMMIVASPGYPDMDIIDCTFSGNSSDSYILMVNGYVNITNSIFYNNNSPKEIIINSMPDSGESTTLYVDYSLLREGYSSIMQVPGNTIHYNDTNISGNPLFLGGDDIHDPLYYSLAAGSPCINAGTPDTLGLGLLPYDLAGNWRVWNGRIDMGCFEYDSEPWVGIDDPFIQEPGLMLSNYPNPFNPSTKISYQLPISGKVKLDIYNLKGQHISTLVDEAKVAGSHTSVWNGTDSSGSIVASGVYLYRLTINGKSQINKMLLMK